MGVVLAVIAGGVAAHAAPAKKKIVTASHAAARSGHTTKTVKGKALTRAGVKGAAAKKGRERVSAVAGHYGESKADKRVRGFGATAADGATTVGYPGIIGI